jgi:hypothetical protein
MVKKVGVAVGVDSSQHGCSQPGDSEVPSVGQKSTQNTELGRAYLLHGGAQFDGSGLPSVRHGTLQFAESLGAGLPSGQVSMVFCPGEEVGKLSSAGHEKGGGKQTPL